MSRNKSDRNSTRRRKISKADKLANRRARTLTWMGYTMGSLIDSHTR